MYQFSAKEPEIPTIALPNWYRMIKTTDPKTIKAYYVMIGFKTAGIEANSLSSASSDFSHADFSGTIIDNGSFKGCNLSYTILNGSKFSFTDLSMTTFREVEVKEARFIDCNFFGSDLRESVYNGCIFENIDFTITNFYASTFNSCVFNHCLFDTTTFTNTSFKDCDLTDSFFTDLALSNFKLINTDLEVAKMYPFAKEMLEECISA